MEGGMEGGKERGMEGGKERGMERGGWREGRRERGGKEGRKEGGKGERGDEEGEDVNGDRSSHASVNMNDKFPSYCGHKQFATCIYCQFTLQVHNDHTYIAMSTGPSHT